MATTTTVVVELADSGGALGALLITFDHGDDVLDPALNPDDWSAYPLEEIEIVTEERTRIRYVITRADGSVWDTGIAPARQNPRQRSIKPRLNRPNDTLELVGDLGSLELTT